MIISHSRKFIFIHIAKCGGMTITKELTRLLCKGDIILSSNNPVIVKQPMYTALMKNFKKTRFLRNFAKNNKIIPLSLKKHSTASEILQVMGKERWEKYYRFSVVRNPYDRCVSAFYWCQKNRGLGLKNNEFKSLIKETSKYPDFKTFVKSNHFLKLSHYNFLAPSSKYLFDENSNSLVNGIVKLENLNADLNKIDLFVNNQLSLSKRENSSARERDYRKYYDQEAKHIITETYQSDLTLFDYQF